MRTCFRVWLPPSWLPVVGRFRSRYIRSSTLWYRTPHTILLKSQRMTLHARIAQALERRPESRDTIPELLAHHYTAAGLFEAATPYWRRAGELAMQRFVLSEAITHLNNGLMLIEKMPPGLSAISWNSNCARCWAPPLSAQHGWAHSEVSRILEPAWSLVELLDHRPAYAPVLHSLWVHYLCVDQLALSLQPRRKSSWLPARPRGMTVSCLSPTGRRWDRITGWRFCRSAPERRCPSCDVRPPAPLAHRSADHHRPTDR